MAAQRHAALAPGVKEMVSIAAILVLLVEEAAQSLAQLLCSRSCVANVSLGHAPERAGQAGDSATHDAAYIRNDLGLASRSLHGERELCHGYALAERAAQNAAPRAELRHQVKVERIVGAECAAAGDLADANHDEINVRSLDASWTVVDVAGQLLNLGVASGDVTACEFRDGGEFGA